MYMGHQGFTASASRRYAAIDTGSRIEGASPHQLVKILFEELLRSLDAATHAERNEDRIRASEKQTRALSILHALETSLDFQRGGEIAVGLSQIYRESRRLILSSAQSHTVDSMVRARGMLAEISDAWSQIG